jgi:GNAT superfamily N-acetyltransferase
MIQLSNWVSIDHCNGNRAKVEVRFGEITQVKNVPDYQAQGLAALLIISVVRRYINHRYEILHNYGGHLTPEKKYALARLRLAFHRKCRFKLAELPSVLNNWSEALYAIRPGRSSKFYQRDISILADLMAFAEYYRHHYFNANKKIDYAR